MPITVTMLQTRQGEGGVLWTAGNSYSASDAFGAYLIASNLATGTIPLPAETSLSPEEAAATVALVQGDGIAAPSNPLFSVVGAAGALTGAYYYVATYVTASGETAPWPGTATVVNPSSQRVNLSSIPIGPAGVIARRIYRTPAVTGTIDAKDYQFLVEIPNNTTTTYIDNALDATLGAPVNWNATNRGRFREVTGAQFAAFSDQSVGLGQGAFATNTGYASTAIGFEALNANTSGRRNTAVGVYALSLLTTGYENTSIGVHAGGTITTNFGNTFLGYAAGSASLPTGNRNTCVGSGSLANGTGANTGNANTAIGFATLQNINTADQCVAVGFSAGKYANNSRQLFIDNFDRTDISGCQNIGLIYGRGESTAAAQVLHLNANVRIGAGNAPVVSGLPAATTGLRGFRGYVTDASAAYTSANLGSTVAGGGANVVPVFCNGTNWIIG